MAVAFRGAVGALSCLLVSGWADDVITTLYAEPTEVLFGTVRSIESPSQRVRIVNGSSKPVEIIRATSSCGCTHAIIAPCKLEPGHGIDLHISLELATYPSNVVRSQVAVITEKAHEPTLYVPVAADVEPEWRVQPEKLELGRIKRNTRPQFEVRLHHVYGQDIRLLEVETPAEIEVKWSPGELKDSPRIAVSLRDTLLDRLNARIVVVTDLPRLPRIEVPVSAEFVGVECTVLPKVLVFNQPATAALLGTIDVIGLNSLNVLGPSITVSDLSVSMETLVANKHYRLLVKPGPSVLPGKKVGKIRFICNENGLVETREVSVFGTVFSPNREQ